MPESEVRIMPNKIRDLTGQKFGRLDVKGYYGTGEYGNRMYKCKCNCGKEIVIPASFLISGNTKSCGCLNIEKSTQRILIQQKKATNVGRFKGTKVFNLNKTIPSNNTSGTKGVSYDKRGKKWEASIKLSGRKRFLGYFIHKEDAIKARKEAEEKYFKPIIEEYQSVIKS